MKMNNSKSEEETLHECENQINKAVDTLDSMKILNKCDSLLAKITGSGNSTNRLKAIELRDKIVQIQIKSDIKPPSYY